VPEVTIVTAIVSRTALSLREQHLQYVGVKFAIFYTRMPNDAMFRAETTNRPWEYPGNISLLWAVPESTICSIDSLSKAIIRTYL
jgi:hypothetical protein